MVDFFDLRYVIALVHRLFYQTVCPHLYETRQTGSCYYFSTGMTSYQSARGSCLSDPDSDLVIISDQEELDYLLERTSADGDAESRWIGRNIVVEICKRSVYQTDTKVE